MSAIICVLCLIGCCVALGFGLPRLYAAIRRIHRDSATRPIREAAFVAQARAEFLPTPSQIRYSAEVPRG